MQEQDLKPIIDRIRRQHTDDEFVEVKACSQQLSSYVWESVSAFANTSGGTIILGIDETNGFKPVKNFAIDKVLDQFVTGIGDGDPSGARITQPPVYHLHRFSLDKAPVIVIEVEELEADKKPCYITGRGLVGGSYKRIDDKDIRLSVTEIYAFQNFLKPSAADRQAIDAVTLDDLFPELVDGILDNARDSRALRGAKTREAKMTRLNILDESGHVSFAGLLVCGDYPQQFFPKLVVDVAVHPGLQKSDANATTRFLDRVICEGPLGEIIDTAVQAIRKNLRTYSVVKGAGRIDQLEIPEEVLREAIANAVVHREYTEHFIGQSVAVDVYPDRVEITNPGGLWGGKTLENLGDGTSACRNASLMKLMTLTPLLDDTGVPTEGNGSGVPFMKNVLASHSLAEPTFVPRIDSFKIIFERRDPNDEVLPQADNDRDEAISERNSIRHTRWSRDTWHKNILSVLSASDPMDIHEIAQALGRTPENTRLYLRELINSGEVTATASPSSKMRQYLLNE